MVPYSKRLAYLGDVTALTTGASLRNNIAGAAHAGDCAQQACHLRYLAKAPIATEQFVAAEAGHCDLQASLRRYLADEIGIHTVDGRLVHGPPQPVVFVPKIRTLYTLRVVSGIVVGGDFFSQRGLIELGAVELVEG